MTDTTDITDPDELAAVRVMRTMLRDFKRLGGSKKDLRRLDRDPVLRRRILEMLFEDSGARATYGLARMIQVCGFSWVHERFTARNVAIDQERYTSFGLEVVCFEQKLTTAQVHGLVAGRGYRLGTLEQLLVFVAEHPEETFVCPHVALGSRVRLIDGRKTFGTPYVEVVKPEDPDDGSRRIQLSLKSLALHEWEEHDHFLIYKCPVPTTRP